MADLCQALNHEWFDFQRQLGDLVRQHQIRLDELLTKHVSSSNKQLPEDNGFIAGKHPCVVSPEMPDQDGQGVRQAASSRSLHSSEPSSPAFYRSEASLASHNGVTADSSNGKNSFMAALTRSSSRLITERSFREDLERSSTKLSIKSRHRASKLASVEHGNWLQRTLFQRCRATVEWWMALEEPPRTSCLARVVDSHPFEVLCSVVILANAVMAVLEANYEMANIRQGLPIGMQICEVAFVSWYTLEIVLKFAVHRLYLYSGDFWQWNVFDTFLVLLALYDLILTNFSEMDPSFMRTMRILKVAKISRAVRLLRFFSELRLILKSLLGSLSSLFWSMMMLVLVFYIFALVLVNSTTGYLALNLENHDEYDITAIHSVLGTVQRTMLTLYMAATGGDDWAVFYNVIVSTGTFNAVVFIVYVGFIEIAVMNILTGLFVESAMKLAQPDQDIKALEVCRAEVSQQQQLMRLCTELDADGSGTLTKEEFSRHMKDGKLKYFLATLGLDIRDAERFFEILDDTNSEIDIGLFVDACMKLKGNATSIDLQDLTLKTVQLQRCQRKFERAMCNRLDNITQAMSQSPDAPRSAYSIHAGVDIAPLQTPPRRPMCSGFFCGRGSFLRHG